ncbi:MAG: hypothetical protein OXD40_08470 [bacterium]|nr:hypothetical protein [bacterium]
MSDDRDYDDQMANLYILEKGLANADALQVFLIALGDACRRLDGPGQDQKQRIFLRRLDEALAVATKKTHHETTRHVLNFRRLLQEAIDEMGQMSGPFH